MDREPTTPVVLIVVALTVAAYVCLVGDKTPHPGLRAWRDGGCADCHSLRSQDLDAGGHLGPDLSGVVSRRGRAWVAQVLAAGAPGMPPSDLDPVRHPALTSLLESQDLPGHER